MDKKRNIKVIVSIVIVLAFVIQFVRFDNNFASNVQNSTQKIDESIINGEKISEHFSTDDNFLIIYDSSDEVSRMIFKNTVRVMTQLKKQYKAEDVKVSREVDVNGQEVIIILEDLGKIINMDSLISYMENGGKIAVLEMPEQNNAFITNYHHFGIVDAGNSQITGGISFDEKFVPAYKQDYIDTEAVENFSVPVTLERDCDVYMKSKDNIPLLWTRDVKAGRFLCFNGTMYQDKTMTGFITRSLALLRGEFIYPIINSKVVWLDDFPAPMSNDNYEEIKKLYNKTIKEFYIDIWWPEMLKIAKKYDVKYTGVMIQTYNDRTEAPFLPAPGEIPDSEFIAMGRELIRSGGELGLHGYNHQSLTREYWKTEELGYKKWKKEADMVEALKAVKEKINRTFPNYEINAYVPPSNVIDDEGIDALKRVFPEIDIIASVYYEDYQGLSYSQEFEYTDKKIMNLPRFSSGYFFGAQNRLSVLNGILAFGAVQHFIHPDDFMDPERNEGRSWPEQLESYEEFAKMIDTRYPFIEANTASEASVNVAKYLGLDYTVDYSEQGIRVSTNASSFPMYMFMHCEKEIESQKNCEVHQIGDNDYFVGFTGNTFSVEFKR